MDNVPLCRSFFKHFFRKKELANPALARYVIEVPEILSGTDERTNREHRITMIFDKIENLPLYAGSFPGAEKVIRFLAECAKKTPETGKHELDGKKLFVNVQEYSPKTFNPDKLEYHKNYIDIQLLLAGAEKLYYAPLDGLETVMPYTPEKDCGFRRLPAPEAGTEVSLAPGNFVVLFPDEGHLPGVGDPAATALKAVVKIAVK